MRVLPYESFRIQTSLSLDHAVERLAQQVVPRRTVELPAAGISFRGGVTAAGFKITPIIDYKNSFSPVITGAFREDTTGLTLLIRMRLNMFVMALLAMWFGLPAFLLVLGIYSLPVSGKGAVAVIAVCAGMIAFGWALVSVCFWREAKNAKFILLSTFSQ